MEFQIFFSKKKKSQEEGGEGVERIRGSIIDKNGKSFFEGERCAKSFSFKIRNYNGQLNLANIENRYLDGPQTMEGEYFDQIGLPH